MSCLYFTCTALWLLLTIAIKLPIVMYEVEARDAATARLKRCEEAPWVSILFHMVFILLHWVHAKGRWPKS